MNANRFRSLAALVVVQFFVIMASAAVAQPTHHIFAFQYTVRQGLSAGLVIAGTLNLDVNPGDGTFTGVLTPGINNETRRPFTAVVFNASPEGLVPTSPLVTSLRVRGQISGHAAHIVLLDVGGPGIHVYGTATTTNDTGHGLHTDPGRTIGWAVGPESDDAGKWGIGFVVEICIDVVGGRVCIRVICCG